MATHSTTKKAGEEMNNLGPFITYCKIRDDIAKTWNTPEEQLCFKQGADWSWNYRHSEVHALKKKIEELEDELLRSDTRPHRTL